MRGLGIQPYRVVLDANVVLSALLFSRGHLVPIREAWQERVYIPLVSHITVTGLLRVLSYPKFRLSVAEIKDLLADYLPYCDTIGVEKLSVDIPPCRDPLDNPFLVLALAGSADFLVSGDGDLLALKNDIAPCGIVKPSEFQELWSKKMRRRTSDIISP